MLSRLKIENFKAWRHADLQSCRCNHAPPRLDAGALHFGTFLHSSL